MEKCPGETIQRHSKPEILDKKLLPSTHYREHL